jgi:hypothetical protein
MAQDQNLVIPGSARGESAVLRYHREKMNAGVKTKNLSQRQLFYCFRWMLRIIVQDESKRKCATGE